MKELKDFVKVVDGSPDIQDKPAFLAALDSVLYQVVFEKDEKRKKACLEVIKEIAKREGVIPLSIRNLYKEMGKTYPGFTVPAINIRGLAYDVARALFRKALELDVGAFILEIARSEIGYTSQRPLEYAAVVMAAALKEGWRGPVFIQGDHFQFSRKNYERYPEQEANYLRGLIKEAVEAEFYNIDIDASTLVDLTRPTVKEQQRPNFEKTAELATLIRTIEPKGMTVSIGGEIGEIGGQNSTPEEFRAFLGGFSETFEGETGLSKISVQTGTTHGGVVLPDGQLAKVKIDFDTLKTLSHLARVEYGLAGCVQHGASTLPEEAFDMFPKVGAAEIHLATGFQNILYDSPSLPNAFREEVYGFVKKEWAGERKEGETEEQFIYSTRKKALGPLKKRWWDLPREVKSPIMKELEERFGLLFHKLKVVGTRKYVQENMKPSIIRHEVGLPEGG
ncbi:MAG TPA: class II fructose-bisphosphate aldolase [Thermodesulfobacteriota bacterium]|nr:class II fructose-bisphosphate aldolase [Thermodesulfobacteriota bacterium]